MDEVELICIEEGRKLRVRIITNGYLKSTNVQFPRDLRVVGRKFKVNKNDIKLITTRGKYFYSVKKNITILDEIINLNNLHIYEDCETTECVICLCNEKNIIFNPCGHYYCCVECSNRIDKCPICREIISSKINKDLLL